MTRSRTRRLGLAALAVVAVAALGTQTVLAGGDDPVSVQQGAPEMEETWNIEDPGSASIAAGASNLEFVALSTGCRIFDTRVAGGMFNVGQSRDLSVANASVPGQGGKAGGCNIPAHAAAVDLSLSTTSGSPTGSGYVRVGPGGVAPTATVLQFLANQGTSVTTTAPLATNDTMRISVNLAKSHLVGDVLGYWQRTLHATVSSAGVLVRGSGVISIDHSLTGFYTVRFERDITECTMVATPAVGVSDVSGVDARVQAVINGTSGVSAQEVFAHVHGYNNTTTVNKQIQITVEC